jgi:hypothetical protein
LPAQAVLQQDPSSQEFCPAEHPTHKFCVASWQPPVLLAQQINPQLFSLERQEISDPVENPHW